MFIGIFYLFIRAASRKVKRLNRLTADLEVKSLTDNKVREYISKIRRVNLRGNRNAVKGIRLAYYKINRAENVDKKLKDELLGILRNNGAIELD